jgi:hypothetical protein
VKNFEDHIEKDDLIQPKVGLCYENGMASIQNGNIGSTVGENTEIIHHQNFHQKKSFSAAGNANIHRNVANAECFIQENYVPVQQAPQITKNQQNEIKKAEDCLIKHFTKASEEERKNAAMVLHKFGRVKKVAEQMGLKNAHDVKRGFHCVLCPPGKIRTFKTMGQLKRHFLQHLRIKPHKCQLPTCEKRFNRTDHLQKHIKKDHPEIKYRQNFIVFEYQN